MFKSRLWYSAQCELPPPTPMKEKYGMNKLYSNSNVFVVSRVKYLQNVILH